MQVMKNLLPRKFPSSVVTFAKYWTQILATDDGHGQVRASPGEKEPIFVPVRWLKNIFKPKKRPRGGQEVLLMFMTTFYIQD